MPALPLSPTAETLFAETRRLWVSLPASAAGRTTFADCTARLMAGHLGAGAPALASSGWGSPALLASRLLPPPPQAISASGEAIARPLGTANRSRRRRGSGWISISAASTFMTLFLGEARDLRAVEAVSKAIVSQA